VTLPIHDTNPVESRTGTDVQPGDGFIFQASYAQARLWFMDQYLSEPSVYNIPMALRLVGPLRFPALQEAFGQVIQRHESLRTTFRWVDGHPHQFIAAKVEVDLPLVNLEHLPQEQRDPRARELILEDVFRPFDLAVGPLVRLNLIRLSPEEHVLSLCMHHIISDGWSMAALLRELKEFYRAVCQGDEAQVPALPVQYADFAQWQRDQLQGDLLERQMDYWKRQLKGAPPLLDLPTDRSRPAIQSHSGDHERITLPPALHTNLKALSRREGVTLFMTLLSGFQILLARYCGQEDIVVGSPIAGRMRAEVEPLIGFFVNMLALRSDFSGNPTVREALARVRTVALGAYEHQDLPFEKLVEVLNPARSRSFSPLFQVAFIHQPDPQPETFFLGLRESGESLERRYTVFDLGLTTWESEGGLHVELEYSTDLFDAPTIQRILAHFQRVLEAMVSDPEQRILNLPLMTEAELHQVLVEWNSTQVEIPGQCVHELFQEQVKRSPQSTAVVFRGQSLSYCALNEKANQVAHILIGHGVKPGMLVGILMERSLELMAGILGILKCGAVYVPLNISHPQEQLSFVIQDTGLAFLLTQQPLIGLIPNCEAKVFTLDLESLPSVGTSTSNPPINVGSDDIAYVMYTSGSSGRPKGVEIRHRGIVRLICGGGFAHLDASSRVLQAAPISFDASTFEIWAPLLHGGQCVLYPERELSFTTLQSVLELEQINMLWLTSSLFNAIVDHAPEMLIHVGQLLIGGEALSVRHVRRALAELPSTQIINGYGPTECTTFACCYPISAALEADQRSIPIGRPIGNTSIYLLDPLGQPVPIGVPGELHVGGMGLGRGYLNLPELTAEKYIPDPFTGNPGERLYKTGDIARYLPDGAIEFLGRKDDQVKIRGHRIEFGEIEAALARYPGISRAMAVVREDDTGDKRIVAYLETTEGTSTPISTQGLVDFLRMSLPPYMVPTAFGLVQSLPMKNDKLDHQSLLDISLTNARPQYHQGAEDPTQFLLTQIWEELLDIRPIGIQDDFFDLGGHSLLALGMLARLEKVFGRRLPVASFYSRTTTIQSLSCLLAESPSGLAESPLVTVGFGTRKRPFFFLHGDFNGGGFYCRNLAQFLASEQPFHVIHPYGLGGQPPPTCVETMAAEHLKLIRGVQPQGPYLLGGHCNGALEAYEMAQQLRDEGEDVDLLVMMDPPDPNLDAPSTNSTPPFSQEHLDALSEEDRREVLFDLFFMAVSAYRPRPYPGAVTLFRSEGNGHLDDKSMDPWTGLAGKSRIVTLVGGHLSSITQHASDLGAQLQSCLDQVQSKPTLPSSLKHFL
jgi:aspartate racemase